MIVLDVNLLLYAYDGRATQHEPARRWWQSVLSGPELIGLPWQTIHGFLRISTDTRISGNQVPMERALALAEQWMKLPNARVCGECCSKGRPVAHWPQMRSWRR